eukprot:PRCOL_00007066-RA
MERAARVVAAYMLAKQAGKDGSAADIKAILSAAGVEADDAKIELLLKEEEEEEDMGFDLFD